MVAYSYYSNEPVFEGTKEEVRNWIMDQAFELDNGKRLFRSWNEAVKYVYDVEILYYTTEDIFDQQTSKNFSSIFKKHIDEVKKVRYYNYIR